MVSGQIMPQAMCRICGGYADGDNSRGDVYRFLNEMRLDDEKVSFYLCAKCAKEVRDWVHARRDERLAKQARERHVRKAERIRDEAAEKRVSEREDPDDKGPRTPTYANGGCHWPY